MALAHVEARNSTKMARYLSERDTQKHDPPNPPVEARIFFPIFRPFLHLHQKSEMLKDTIYL